MLQKKLSTEEVQMTERKGGVEEELSKIAPVLEAAKAAVGGIKSDNLNEMIRSAGCALCSSSTHHVLGHAFG